MENYVFLKAKLLKNLTESEYAVLNFDDPVVRGFAQKTKAKIVWFSVQERVQGAYYENGDLYYLENWANKNIRFWGNGEVVKYKPMKSNTALVEARRIKLDASLSEKQTWLVMVVDGFEDEEAGYLDCAFELEDEETIGGE
jgi:UDP-N-acetylmuramoylalanine-D-glutamate ligase